MINMLPKNQTKLFGLEKYLNELVRLHESDHLPNKILLSGQKVQGKTTLSYHFINYVLSKNEKFANDLENLEINQDNHSFKTYK